MCILSFFRPECFHFVQPRERSRVAPPCRLRLLLLVFHELQPGEVLLHDPEGLQNFNILFKLGSVGSSSHSGLSGSSAIKLAIFDVGLGELLSWIDEGGADEVQVLVIVVPRTFTLNSCIWKV